MKRIFLAAASAAALYSPAAAQTQADLEPNKKTETAKPEDEIVIVANRVGYLEAESVTAPASVVSELEIQARNQAYVTDYLRSLPGLAISQSGPAGGLTQLRLRGAEANQVLVLIDGVEVSNPNTGEFDFAGLRASDVVRIEVLRGEQSALWGADALGGVINIITRAGQSEKRFTASVEAGSFETLEGQLSAVIPLAGAALSVNGNAFTTDGYDISGQNAENDGTKSRSLNVGLNNVTIGSAMFSAKYGTSHLENEFDSDVDFDGLLNNTNEILIVDTQTARADLRVAALGFEHLFQAALTDTETANPRSSFPNSTDGRRTKLSWAAKADFDGHVLTLLAETEDEKFSNDGGPGAGQNQTESIRNDALAADYLFEAGPVTLTASGRQDFNERFDDSFTWRIGGGYEFVWSGRARGSVGTGVKNPTMTEIFGYFPGSFIGNAEIQPERSLGYNIGYTQAFLGDRFSLSVDYFRSELEDEILTVFNPDFSSTVINSQTDSEREGVEIETRWKASDQINIRGSMTFLDASENGAPEIRRPEFLASATATWRPVENVSLTASLDHTGEQLDTDFGTSRKVELKPYTLVGLNAAYDVSDHLTVTLRGDNLLDEDYEEVFGYHAQGRAVYGGLRANF